MVLGHECFPPVKIAQESLSASLANQFTTIVGVGKQGKKGDRSRVPASVVGTAQWCWAALASD